MHWLDVIRVALVAIKALINEDPDQRGGGNATGCGHSPKSLVSGGGQLADERRGERAALASKLVVMNIGRSALLR